MHWLGKSCCIRPGLHTPNLCKGRDSNTSTCSASALKFNAAHAVHLSPPLPSSVLALSLCVWCLVFRPPVATHTHMPPHIFTPSCVWALCVDGIVCGVYAPAWPPPQVPGVLRVLLERLRNDITRLAAVKAFDTLAHSTLDLGLGDALDAIMVSRAGGRQRNGILHALDWQ